MNDPYAMLCDMWRSEDEQADAEARWEAMQAGDVEEAAAEDEIPF